MKQIAVTFIIVTTFVWGRASNNFINAIADSSTDIFALEKKTFLQRISFEKTRIAYEYNNVDKRLFNIVDSVSEFIVRQPVPSEKRNHYLFRLLTFLQNINRPYSESYLKSGAYINMLSYYPVLIEWDKKNELEQNIKRFSAFTIKAVRLIPNDIIAEKYLSSYTLEHPDDIFRYTEEFDDREFALRILEKAVKLSPESAKRYYATANVVNDILSESKDSAVIISYEIFERFGIKSRAFILLNEIVNKDMSCETADSLANNREALFHFLIHLFTSNKAKPTYSMYRYLDYYSTDLLRKVNEESLSAPPTYESFSHYTPDEMFTLLSYGFQESAFTTFHRLLQKLSSKSSGITISNELITSLDREKLKGLVVYCEENRVLDLLMNLVDDEIKEYLLGLTTEIKPQSLTPPLKSFEKQISIPKPVSTKQIPDTLTAKKTAVIDTIPPEFSTNVPIKDIRTLEAKGTSIIDTGILTRTRPQKVHAAGKGADMKPNTSSEPVEPVKINLDEKTKTLVSLKKNIVQTIQDIPSFIEKDYAETLLNYAAEKEPDELLKKIEFFKSKRFSKNVLERCANNAPVSLKRYLHNSMQPVNYILQYSTDPVVKKIFEINHAIGYKSKPLLLLDDIINGKIQTKDAIEVSADPDRLFNSMVKIISREKFVAKYSIDREMRDYSLRFIREINDKIAAGAVQPFNSIENLTSDNLYFLMLYGRDEVFTSTFNGLFNLFMQHLPDNDGDAFLRYVNHNQFRDFLSLCSNFGTLDEFLSRFTKETKQKLLISYISGLEKEKDDLNTIVLIAEAISNLNDRQLLTLLQSNIKKEYDRVTSANDQLGISIYGILSSMISGNATVETNWYKKVAEQFKISPVAILSCLALFNEQKACVEQMYFYNDEDGRSSFINFINTYKHQPSWIIEEQKSYVRIYSRNGMRVEIFANRPEQEESGINDIHTYLKENNISPSVIIHRGHSFYTESTLEKVPPSAKLIFVGSCGGFYKISMALENAPEAHIISTKQIGTKSVNDAMLFALNENIKAGKDIVWNEFWNKMREKLSGNQYFSDYIPPNKNLESIFIRAYYKILGV